LKVTADKKEYRREYMRWYMRKRRKGTKESTKTQAQALPVGFVGPPCPANLPDRPTDGRHYVGQIALLKAQLAHTLQLWREASEDLLLQIEMLQVENEYLQRDQQQESQAVQESCRLPTAAKPVPVTPKTLPAPSKPEASKPDPELDQYLKDKAQGFVDPDRKPLDSHDEITF
jgi:hypothetical protein